MSTRSQLRFIRCTEFETDDGETETVRGIAQVYRHTDGYPSAVLAALDRLVTLQNVTGTKRWPEYAAANFIFLQKLQGLGLYLNRTGDVGESLDADDLMAVVDEADVSRLVTLEQPHFLLSYGVEDPAEGSHGDEE